jgi:hypothetical protein
MLAALSVAPTAPAITAPIVITVALATVVLIGIAVYVRRARRSGSLSGVNATASGVSAAGVLVSALLVSVALGNAAAASATEVQPGAPTVQVQVTDQPTNDLDGLQLPTE